MQLKKISMPAPWKVNGNSKGVGGFQKPNFLNKSMTLKWNFRKGGGIQTKKPSVGGVWIFSGTIQSLRKLCILQIKVLVTSTVSHHVVNLSNRPQVSVVYKLINHAGCSPRRMLVLNMRKICKARAAGEWFTNSSSVLPTSQVVYQLINHRNLWSITFI